MRSHSYHHTLTPTLPSPEQAHEWMDWLYNSWQVPQVPRQIKVIDRMPIITYQKVRIRYHAEYRAIQHSLIQVATLGEIRLKIPRHLVKQALSTVSHLVRYVSDLSHCAAQILRAAAGKADQTTVNVLNLLRTSVAQPAENNICCMSYLCATAQ